MVQLLRIRAIREYSRRFEQSRVVLHRKFGIRSWGGSGSKASASVPKLPLHYLFFALSRPGPFTPNAGRGHGAPFLPNEQVLYFGIIMPLHVFCALITCSAQNAGEPALAFSQECLDELLASRHTMSLRKT